MLTRCYAENPPQKENLQSDFFTPSEVYTEKEFIEAIKNNTIGIEERAELLSDLWKKNYRWMTVRNVENGDVIRINRNHLGNMYRDYATGRIQYTYVDRKYGEQSSKEYELGHRKENCAIWVFVAARTIEGS